MSGRETDAELLGKFGRCPEASDGIHEIRDVCSFGEPCEPWCARCGQAFHQEDSPDA